MRTLRRIVVFAAIPILGLVPASPVAADGHLYFVSEQGEVRVVKAGAEFQLLAVNDMGDVCMAVPAISGGMLFVRSQNFLFALGRKQPEQ
jgi:hypothetical protein